MGMFATETKLEMLEETEAMNFQDNLIENERGVERVVKGSKRVAVLGIKTEEQAGQPAFYVADIW